MPDPPRESAGDPNARGGPRGGRGAAGSPGGGSAAGASDAATPSPPAAGDGSAVRVDRSESEAAIGPARPTERSAAIARIAGRRSPLIDLLESRFRHSAHGPPWLWVARGLRGEIDSAAVAIRNPGRTATLLPPLSVPPASRAATVAVIEAMTAEILQEGEVDLVQAMTEPGRESPDPRPPGGALAEAGFRPLATLRFMERPPAPPPPPPSLPADLAIETWSEAIEESAERLLTRTYDGTLDCPGLAGVRRTSDILAGHRGSGPFDPRLWRLLRRRGGELLGVAMLNRQPAASCDELVYFGLAPEARGRGLAAMLLDDLLAHAASSRRIALAVDERNGPALRLYRRAGFVPGGARVAWIRSRRPLGVA